MRSRASRSFSRSLRRAAYSPSMELSSVIGEDLRHPPPTARPQSLVMMNSGAPSNS
jgi:hypothetical protein